MKRIGLPDGFAAADSYLMILILRASSEIKLADAFQTMELYAQSVIDLHRFKAEQAIGDAIDLVNWCFDKGYLSRSETFNINHWLHWFNDPVFFHQWNCSEDFRYPEDNHE